MVLFNSFSLIFTLIYNLTIFKFKFFFFLDTNDGSDQSDAGKK